MQGCFSQDILQGAVESMQDCFACFSTVRDKDGKITDFKLEYMNKVGCMDNLVEKEECLGRKLSEISPLNTRIGLFDEYCRVIETGEPLTKESLIYENIYEVKYLSEAYIINASKCEDGIALIWKEITSKKIKELLLIEAHNNHINLEALLERQKQDINYRKANEEKLRESEETIRALLNSITEAIVLCDLKGNVETINETAAKRYGKTPEDMIGKCLFDFMPDELAKVRKNYVRDNVTFGKPVRFTDARAGMYLDNFLYPVFNSKGEAVKFAAFTQDITERKLAEETQRRLAAIVESTDEAIVGKTGDGIITSWNKAAEEMYGYTAEEIIGNSIFTVVPEHEIAEMEKILTKIRKGERISQKETVRKRKDGKLIDVSVTISPMVDSEGRVLGASSIAHDITERKQAELELALKNEEIKSQRAEAIEANKLKSQFLANMSHELRTPLNSIIGFTTRVIKKSGDTLPIVQLDNLKIVKEEAQHLLDLINSLLDYSKVEAGKMEVHREAFNLIKVVEEVSSMVKTLMDGKTLDYRYELCSEENLTITSDRMKVKQILINLLSNAIKYSEKGTIRLSISEENRYYCIKVEDEGIGIAPENLDNIFDEFRQIDGSYTRKVGGTGLGLSITKKFIEMLGGRIEVRSTLGIGSCFTVYIPIEIG